MLCTERDPDIALTMRKLAMVSLVAVFRDIAPRCVCVCMCVCVCLERGGGGCGEGMLVSAMFVLVLLHQFTLYMHAPPMMLCSYRIRELTEVEKAVKVGL